MATIPDRHPEYLHGADASEQARLEAQAKLLGGAEFLPPLRAGMRILDVGCGTGAVTREVAARVAPGEVFGVDREEAQLETARRLAAEQDVTNVRFLRGDAAALDFPDDEFDAVYARFLLEHVASPPAVVREMTRVVRPGGWVCAYEWENGCDVTYPDSPAIRELWHGILELQQARGGDPWIARKLYAVFRRAGLTGVQAEGRAWTITADETEKLGLFIDGAREITRQTRDGLLKSGLATQELLTQAESEYQRLLDHTDTFIFAGFCRAVGTKTSKGD